MYEHLVLQQGLQLLKEALRADKEIIKLNLLLGVLVVILLRKSLLGRYEHDKYHTDELRDEILFRQPESNHLGDCPICCLPLQLPGDLRKTTIYSCCSKVICNGCVYSGKLDQKREDMEQLTCPFCRHPQQKTMEEADEKTMKRVAANDPVALWQMGTKHLHKKDYEGAFNCNKMAAELGDVEAHHSVGMNYLEGKGVEKDEIKGLYHLEEAAIAGHPEARYELGLHEWNKYRYERAVDHWIIAANLGDNKSLKELKQCYKDRLVTKEDFAAALRSHQAAVDATKSPQREIAEKDEKRRREMELSMMSKKKKAKGNARGKAKSRKESMNDSAVNEIEQDDDALLEQAIRLAAAEREQLEAAAKNDDKNNTARCNHGCGPLPRGHVCARFIPSFVREVNASNSSCDMERFEDAFEATNAQYAAVYTNPGMLEHVTSHFLAKGTGAILEEKDDLARQSAVLAVLFEQTRDTLTGNVTGELRNCIKSIDLSRDFCDEHTLVSIFKKRIPCKCLKKRYKEVKSIVKMGLCMNPDCPLPDGQVERSKLMRCEQCQLETYCSSECQKAAWPQHKNYCVDFYDPAFSLSSCS